MSINHRNTIWESRLFVFGTSLIIISVILSLAFLPLYLNRRIGNLEKEKNDVLRKIDALKSDSEEQDYYNLVSVTLKIDLDVLLLEHPDSAIIDSRKTTILENEIFALIALARNVLNYSELQEKQVEWVTMNSDQLEKEEENIREKFNKLLDSYNELMILNEEKLTSELNLKEFIGYLIPALFIVGTILDESSTYLRHKRKK